MESISQVFSRTKNKNCPEKDQSSRNDNFIQFYLIDETLLYKTVEMWSAYYFCTNINIRKNTHSFFYRNIQNFFTFLCYFEFLINLLRRNIRSDSKFQSSYYRVVLGHTGARIFTNNPSFLIIIYFRNRMTKTNQNYDKLWQPTIYRFIHHSQNYLSQSNK